MSISILLSWSGGVWARRLAVVGHHAARRGGLCRAFKMVSPKYRSETRILIEPRAPAFANAQAADANASQLLDELNISSQVQLLQSADLIKQVISSQKLYDLPNLDAAADSSALGDILIALNLKKSPLANPPEERVINASAERLQVYQVFAPASLVSPSPRRTRHLQRGSRTPWRPLTWPSRAAPSSTPTRKPRAGWSLRSRRFRTKVSEAEQKVAEYRTARGLLLTNGGGNFQTQQLNDISAELDARAWRQGERPGACAIRAQCAVVRRAVRHVAGHHVVAGDPAAEGNGIWPAVVDIRPL